MFFCHITEMWRTQNYCSTSLSWTRQRNNNYFSNYETKKFVKTKNTPDKKIPKLNYSLNNTNQKMLLGWKKLCQFMLLFMSRVDVKISCIRRKKSM